MLICECWWGQGEERHKWKELLKKHHLLKGKTNNKKYLLSQKKWLWESRFCQREKKHSLSIILDEFISRHVYNYSTPFSVFMVCGLIPLIKFQPRNFPSVFAFQHILEGSRWWRLIRGCSCLILLEYSPSWVPGSITFCIWADKALKQQQQKC